MSALLNDGTVPYGSRVLGITGSSNINMIAEDIEVTRTVEVIERYNEVGEPSGQVIIPRWVTGNATLQLSGSSPFIPTGGNTFSAAFSGSAENFILTEISQAEGQVTDKKIRVSFRKKINA
jgi:hypothetical protein